MPRYGRWEYQEATDKDLEEFLVTGWEPFAVTRTDTPQGWTTAVIHLRRWDPNWKHPK